jgi:hypothetical protein
MKSAPNFQRFLAVGYAVFFALVAASQCQAAAANERVALVIGNSAYQNTEHLPNPKNDAEDMSARLTNLGFRVILGQDLEKADMDRKIAEFAGELSRADVAVFFYAGHGLQVGGQNYLVPVDAKMASGSSLDFEAIRLDLVQRAMERGAKTSIIFLDACRDNPLARTLARSMGTRGIVMPRGLAAVQAGIGTLVSFSTQPGNVALDGEGRNSPFAKALVRHLGDRESLSDILIKVRNDVVAATKQQQVPWEHSALRARFYFKAPKSEPSQRTSPETVTRSTLTYDQQAELDLWSTIDKKNPTILESFVEEFPNGRFASTARRMIELLRNKQTKVPLAHEDDAKSQAGAAGKASGAAAQAAEQKIAAVDAARLPADSFGDDGRARARIENLAADVQSELKRVGCYDGAIDNDWGNGSRNALEEFAQRSGTELASDEPTFAALEAVKASKGRVCPVTPASRSVRRKVDRPSRSKSGRRSKSSPSRKPTASHSREMGGKCAPIYGPYGAHPNPWCK